MESRLTAPGQVRGGGIQPQGKRTQGHGQGQQRSGCRGRGCKGGKWQWTIIKLKLSKETTVVFVSNAKAVKLCLHCSVYSGNLETLFLVS